MIRLSDLYHNNLSHDVDAIKPAFRTFLGEEHPTFRLKMFYNLDQLRLQFERENLHEVNAKNCLEVLGTQFEEFFASQRVNSSDHLHQCLQQDFKDYMYCKPETYKCDELKSLDILEDFIDKSVIKYGELWMKENESKDVQTNPVQAVDDNLVVMESSGIELENNNSENALSKLVNETQMWVPTGKIFTSSTTKVDNEPPAGLNEDITNPYECEQTLNVSVCTLNLSVGPTPQLLTPGYISSGLVQNPSYSTQNVPPSKKDLDILFQPLFDEYFSPPSSVVSPVLPAATPLPADTTGTPSSTTIDQDAPSVSTSPTTHEIQAPIIHQGVA
ncbi:hypothetical protein Tco_1490425 [Tanacetum coccineum]